jgi:LmbE family N-acetylglucosaminyl deacetylase
MADVVVISPHLDDAVFSLGATIAKMVRSGATVRVLTVFACDPRSSAPAAWWDRNAGFRSEGEAATARRAEDELACSILGAKSQWLPFSDASYEHNVDDETIKVAVHEAVEGAEVVLLPGFPLRHVDHLRLTGLLLAHPFRAARQGLYVEQPYAKWDGGRRFWHRPSLPAAIEALVDRPVQWTRLAADPRDRRAKLRAASAYESQLPLLARPSRVFAGRLLLRRIALYEALRGGEAVAWLT